MRASAPGRTEWSTRTAVASNAAQASVAVPSLADAAAPLAQVPSPSATPPSAAAAPGGGWSRDTAHMLALVGGGLGVVGVGVGTAFGLVASSKKSDYQQHQAGGRCIDARCATLSQDAVSAANVSTIAFVAGAVLVAAGAVLWITAPAPSAEKPALAVVPMGDARGLGAGLAGSF